MLPRTIRRRGLLACATALLVAIPIGANAIARDSGGELIISAMEGQRSFASAADPDDERFLSDIHSAGIVAPDGQAIRVGHQVVDLTYRVVQEFGVYDYHVPAFVQAAMNAYRPHEGSDDERFLSDIRSAGIVAPDGQAIRVGHQVVDLVYRVVQDFGVYDYHVPAFVQAAMNAYQAGDGSLRSGSEDGQFLSSIRSAGFTRAQISDEEAVDGAHKIVYWVCDRDGPSRLDVENLLFTCGIAERRGPQSVNTFASAALQTYRHSNDPTHC